MDKVKIKKIWANLNLIRSIPAFIAISLSSQKEIIKKDVQRWASGFNVDHFKYGPYKYINWFLNYEQQYRNLLYYRLKQDNIFVPLLLKIFYWPMSTTIINTQTIGPGLIIYHGQCSDIAAKSIGENCTVYHQAIIGRTNDRPTLEDNVTIAAAAVVMGGITIGKNSIVGANASVFKSVPPNCTVVGNPAYIVKRDGVKVKEEL